MRRIKFRAWDDVTNELHYAGEDIDLIFQLGSEGIECTDIRSMTTAGDITNDMEHLIYQQSTGLEDKNGQEIYEGDLIRSNSMHKNNVFEVIYGRCSFEFIRETGSRYRADQLLWDDIEIVGNIHVTGRTRKLDILYQEHQHLKDDPNLPF